MESAAGRVVDIYQRHAIAWSRDHGDRLDEKAWLDRSLTLLPDEPTVLDIGCGSGVPVAGYLIEHRCRVTGVDASSAMIAMCTDRFPEQDWHVAETPHLPGQFAGIELSEFYWARQRAKRMVWFWVAAVLIVTGIVAAAAWTLGSNIDGLI